MKREEQQRHLDVLKRIRVRGIIEKTGDEEVAALDAAIHAIESDVFISDAEKFKEHAPK